MQHIQNTPPTAGAIPGGMAVAYELKRCDNGCNAYVPVWPANQLPEGEAHRPVTCLACQVALVYGRAPLPEIHFDVLPY